VFVATYNAGLIATFRESEDSSDGDLVAALLMSFSKSANISASAIMAC